MMILSGTFRNTLHTYVRSTYLIMLCVVLLYTYVHVLFSLCRTNRLCNKDCVINGISIKAGMQVFISIYDVHRDPEVWPEPEKFIPERWVLEVLKLYS